MVPETSITFSVETFGSSCFFGCSTCFSSTMVSAYGTGLSTILLLISMLLTEEMSLAEGRGFLSSTFGFGASTAGFVLIFGSTFGSTLGFWMMDVSTGLFGWIFDCWAGLTGWVGCVGCWTGFVAGWVGAGLDYYFGGWVSWGCLLTTGFIPPNRRSSISFSKLDLFLLASIVCFSYLAG